MTVYKITNLINGKAYIGQTILSLTKRWYNHCHPKSGTGCSARRDAIIKHGKDNFTIEVLAICISREDLDTKEIEFIKNLNSLSPNGYNLQLGGSKHKIFSEETKLKMSVAKLGKKQSPEMIAARVKGMKNKVHSQATKNKISKANKGRKPWTTGKKRGPMSLEQRQKLSEAGKRYFASRKSA